jgi:hypothetical protein
MDIPNCLPFSKKLPSMAHCRVPHVLILTRLSSVFYMSQHHTSVHPDKICLDTWLPITLPPKSTSKKLTVRSSQYSKSTDYKYSALH